MPYQASVDGPGKSYAEGCYPGGAQDLSSGPYPHRPNRPITGGHVPADGHPNVSARVGWATINNTGGGGDLAGGTMSDSEVNREGVDNVVDHKWSVRWDGAGTW